MTARRWTIAAWAAAVLYTAVLTALSLKRHHDFQSGYDLAIFDQLTWLLAHGHEPFSTVRGRPMLGDHFQPGLALLTPLGAIGRGPGPLLCAQSAGLALVAPALQALARQRGASEPVALGVAVLWLASPLTHSANLFDFHPEVFVPVLVAVGALALERRRPGLFVATAVLASSLKEDISLVYLAWGLALWFRGNRRLGPALALGGAAWFVLATKVGIEAFGGNLDYYSARFGGERGTTLGAVARAVFTHPGTTAHDLVTTLNVKMLVDLVASTAGLCLLAPLALVPAAPALAANMLSAYTQQHYVTLHYHVVASGVFAVAGALGAPRAEQLARRLPKRAIPALLAFAAIAGTPLSPALDVAQGRYPGPNQSPAARAARLEAVQRIPDGAAVATQFDVVTRLAERRLVYVLPEPFLLLERNGPTWSRQELRSRTNQVRYVLLDSGATFPGEPRELALVRARLHGLGFRTVFSRDGVRLLERRA